MALVDCLFACFECLIHLFYCPSYHQHHVCSAPSHLEGALPPACDGQHNFNSIDDDSPSYIETPVIPLRKQSKRVSKSIPSTSKRNVTKHVETRSDDSESSETSAACNSCSGTSNPMTQTHSGNDSSVDIDSTNTDSASSEFVEMPLHNWEASVSSLPSAEKLTVPSTSTNCSTKMGVKYAKSDKKNVKHDAPKISLTNKTRNQNFVLEMPYDSSVSSKENVSTNGPLERPKINRDLMKGSVDIDSMNTDTESSQFVEMPLHNWEASVSNLPSAEKLTVPSTSTNYSTKMGVKYAKSDKKNVKYDSPKISLTNKTRNQNFVLEMPDDSLVYSQENVSTNGPLKLPKIRHDSMKGTGGNFVKDLSKTQASSKSSRKTAHYSVPIANEINLPRTSMTVSDNDNAIDSFERVSRSAKSSKNRPPTTSVAESFELQPTRNVRFEENKYLEGASESVSQMKSPNNEAGRTKEPNRNDIPRPYGPTPYRIVVKYDNHGRAYYYAVPDPNLQFRFGNQYSNGYNNNYKRKN